jgi:uncharacterized membrane protein YbhN (UPF0104 family)
MPPRTNPADAGGTVPAVARFAVKLLLTVGAFYLLLTHHVTDAEGRRVTTFTVIQAFLPKIDLAVFLRFVVLAAAIKLVGILASMYRWVLLLRGQGIELPFRHVFGSFLIGRFLGTFLPSTIGLDGYKLYDAARFSGRSVEASGATLVEKVIGFTGIFMTYLAALPLGVSIFGDRAGQVLLVTVPVALLPLVACFALFAWPGPRLVAWATARIPLGPYAGFLSRLAGAVSAYGGRAGTIAAAAALSFVVHFATAAMYFFTALAIGVTAAEASFWQVTFASTIQILATVLSPFTIAGEGIREIAQYYLLSHLMGPAEAIVSAALGFWAAEGLTLFGGVIWWARRRDYTPAYCRVHGAQVDWAAAADAARDLGFAPTRNAAGAGGAVEPLRRRLFGGLLLGLCGGVAAGSLLGLGEALIGQLIDALRRAGLYDQTAIVVTADHGEEFHEHGGWWHGTTLYNEAIAVPLIVKWPRGAEPAPRPEATDGRARLLDVAPTLVSLAGVGRPETWQGEDLRAGVPADRVLFAEEDHEGNVLAAVQTGRWKLITANPHNPRGLAPTELYDHASDPAETRNRAGDHLTEVARLQHAIAEVGTQAVRQAVTDGGEADMDSVTRARLRALGYVE